MQSNILKLKNSERERERERERRYLKRIFPQLVSEKHKGFTLIELLVVVVVIGVLAGMSFVMIQGVIDTARMARSKSFARGIQRQLALNEVGVWRFDDYHSPTRVHDASGWGNHGTLHVGPLGNASPTAAWVPGVFGRALSFDGSDDFVTNIPLNGFPDPMTNITIEFWASPSGLLTGNSLFIVVPDD